MRTWCKICNAFDSIEMSKGLYRCGSCCAPIKYTVEVSEPKCIGCIYCEIRPTFWNGNFDYIYRDAYCLKTGYQIAYYVFKDRISDIKDSESPAITIACPGPIWYF